MVWRAARKVDVVRKQDIGHAACILDSLLLDSGSASLSCLLLGYGFTSLGSSRLSLINPWTMDSDSCQLTKVRLVFPLGWLVLWPCTKTVACSARLCLVRIICCSMCLQNKRLIRGARSHWAHLLFQGLRFSRWWLRLTDGENR